MNSDSKQFTIDDVTHGIVAYVRDEENPNQLVILHFCGYSEAPTEADFNNLKDELQNSEDFGLQGIDFELAEANEEMLNYFKDSSRFEEEQEAQG
jgi:hypothetical protein